MAGLTLQAVSNTGRQQQLLRVSSSRFYYSYLYQSSEQPVIGVTVNYAPSQSAALGWVVSCHLHQARWPPAGVPKYCQSEKRNAVKRVKAPNSPPVCLSEAP